jgi:predicted RNase H-like nuclease (RuvC/YqgF family)
MPAPKEPPYSCPRIDAAIEEMEEARKIHNSLREWGAWWKDRCEEIERDYEKQVDELKSDVRRLEDIVGDLERELADTRRAHAQAEAEIRDLVASA